MPSTPFIGMIIPVGFNFAPVGWALCNGQALSIADNQVIFQLIGTTYGGDGQTTFNLPDLRGRVPIHMGSGSGLSNRAIGESAGAESVTLTTSEVPDHGHTLGVSNLDGTTRTASGNYPAKTDRPLYTAAANADSTLNSSSAGGSQPHDNMQPYLSVNFIIALQGVFPTQS